MLQFEQGIIQNRIDLGLLDLIEKTDAADTLSEEPAQHAVLGPDLSLVVWDVLDDVVGGGADNIFGGVRLFGRNSARRISLSNP